MVHAWRGRGAEAVDPLIGAFALALDPMIYYFNSLASTANLFDERYERSIELAERSLRENCLHTPSLRTLAAAQVLAGRIGEARATVRGYSCSSQALLGGSSTLPRTRKSTV